MMLHWAWPWYNDWIRSKQEIYEARQERMTRLCSTDSSLTRARRMCEHAGLTMDMNLMALLPAMAEVVEAYSKLDTEAAKETSG